jgi:hypothetical protein
VRGWIKQHELAVVGKGKGQGGHGKGQSSASSWGPVARELAALLNSALKTPERTEWDMAKTENAFKLRRAPCEPGGSRHCLAVALSGGQHVHTKGSPSRCEVYLLPDNRQVKVRCHGGPMGSRCAWERVKNVSAFNAIWPHIERPPVDYQMPSPEVPMDEAEEEPEPMDEGEEPPQPTDEGGVMWYQQRVLPPKNRDTSKGAQATLARGVIRLSAPAWQLTGRLRGKVYKHKKLARELREAMERENLELAGRIKEEMAVLEDDIMPFFDELFVPVGKRIIRLLTPRDSSTVVAVTREKLSDLPTDMRPYKSLLIKWVDDRPDTRHYAKEVCMMTETNPDVFSSFVGFPGEHEIELRHPLTYDMEVVKPMLEAIDRLTNHNKELTDELLNFIADIVQNPHERPTRCFVIKGAFGSGKSSTIQYAMEPILGSGDPEAHGGLGEESLYISLRDAFQLQRDKFNTVACGKLLIVLDDQPPRSEKGRSPTKGELSDFIKNWITTLLTVMEAKGVDPRQIKELARLIVLTNHDNVVDMDDIRQRGWYTWRWTTARQVTTSTTWPSTRTAARPSSSATGSPISCRGTWWGGTARAPTCRRRT